MSPLLGKMSRRLHRGLGYERERIAQNGSAALNGRAAAVAADGAGDKGITAAAKPYQVISDYYGTPKPGDGPDETFKAKMAEAEKALGAAAVGELIGRRIMAGKPAGLLPLFQQFAQYIRNPANGFAWDGSVAGGAGYKLLEKNAKVGECALFRGAFALLCWAPEPWGLGLDRAKFESKLYAGRFGQGFVCSHPAEGIMGVAPNVKGQNLYVWRNHKVLLSEGTYYDVMYKTSFRQYGAAAEDKDMEQMALYHVLGEEMRDTAKYTITVPTGQPNQRKWFKQVAETNPLQYEEGPLEAGG